MSGRAPAGREGTAFVQRERDRVVQLRLVPGGTAMKTVDRDAGHAELQRSCARLQWRVHHELPYRTRFRLVASQGRQAASAAVEHALEALQGVRSAHFSNETGSLLVLHDGSDDTKRRLRHVLESLTLDDAASAGASPPPARRNDVVKAAVLSLVRAALPPAPRAALQLVESLATLRAPGSGHA
jgi:hypothetical protein